MDNFCEYMKSLQNGYQKYLCWSSFPAGADVFKTSSERLKNVTTSYDQTRRRYDVWKKTSDFRRLEDV